MCESVSPSLIAQTLREPGDVDLWIDVKAAVSRLPEDEQTFLSHYSNGLNPTEIVRKMGATKKNPKRWYESIMKKLYEEVNKHETRRS